MVWGMPLPPGPFGEYEGKVDIYSDGWRTRLCAHYDDHFTGQRKAYYRDANRYSFCVGEKFIYERGRKQPGPDDIVVTPIEDHEPPLYFYFTQGNKSPASVISLPNRILAISEPFKAFVEWLEPDVHQFFPIEIGNKRGSVYSDNYYIFVIGQWLDSFSPEKSSKDLLKSNETTTWYGIPHSKKDVTGLALSKPEFGTAHVWRERAFGEWLNCFSDRFMAEVQDAGLKMPRQWRMMEV
jgi:hypothetical protein